MTKYPSTKEVRNPNDEALFSYALVLRASSFLRTWVFRHSSFLLGCLLLLGCGASSTPVAPAPRLDPALFDGERALEEVIRFVALGPRDAGTPGAEKAATYIWDRFVALGVEAEVDSFDDAAPGGTTTFHNVIARIPGSGTSKIILGAHFDTKSGIGPGFEGANDSGSGVGALLELARAMKDSLGDRLPGAELIFVAFDGEECKVRYGPQDGFHGSRHHARQLRERGEVDSVRAMILLDMIGDRDLNVTLPRNSSPELIQRAFRAARTEGVREYFTLFSSSIGDDHVAYLREGIAAIDLIDFKYGSQPGLHDYWHVEADTLDKISGESLGIVGRVTMRMVDELMTNDEIPSRP